MLYVIEAFRDYVWLSGRFMGCQSEFLSSYINHMSLKHSDTFLASLSNEELPGGELAR